MKDYAPENPAFSETIKITETSDPAHADLINMPIKQLHQNTLVNQLQIAGLFGFTYDDEVEAVSNIMGCHRDEDTIYLPSALAELAEDETIKLTEGTAIRPYTPGGGGGTYELPPATATTLGGVKIGEGVKVEPDGTISVDIEDISEDVSETAADLVEQNATQPTDEEIDGLWGDGEEEDPENPEEP